MREAMLTRPRANYTEVGHLVESRALSQGSGMEEKMRPVYGCL